MIRFVFVLVVYFNSFESKGEYAEPFFNINPKHCLVDVGTVCEEIFVFNWHLTIPENVCIFMVLEKIEHKVYCSQTKNQKKLELALKIEQDTLFRLVSKTQMMEGIVLVQVIGVDVRKVRKRVWSVF